MSLHVSIVEPNFEANEESGEDICADLKCDLGERCIISDDKPVCDCIEVCETPEDKRQQVFLLFLFISIIEFILFECSNFLC